MFAICSLGPTLDTSTVLGKRGHQTRWRLCNGSSVGLIRLKQARCCIVLTSGCCNPLSDTGIEDTQVGPARQLCISNIACQEARGWSEFLPAAQSKAPTARQVPAKALLDAPLAHHLSARLKACRSLQQRQPQLMLVSNGRRALRPGARASGPQPRTRPQGTCQSAGGGTAKVASTGRVATSRIQPICSTPMLLGRPLFLPFSRDCSLSLRPHLLHPAFLHAAQRADADEKLKQKASDAGLPRPAAKRCNKSSGLRIAPGVALFAM